MIRTLACRAPDRRSSEFDVVNGDVTIRPTPVRLWDKLATHQRWRRKPHETGSPSFLAYKRFAEAIRLVGTGPVLEALPHHHGECCQVGRHEKIVLRQPNPGGSDVRDERLDTAEQHGAKKGPSRIPSCENHERHGDPAA